MLDPVDRKQRMKPEAEGKDDACLGPPKASASPGVRPACAGARVGEWVKPISLQARRAESRSSCHLVRCKAQGVLEDKRQVLLSSGSLWGSLALGSPPKPATYSASPQGLAAAGFFTVPRRSHGPHVPCAPALRSAPPASLWARAALNVANGNLAALNVANGNLGDPKSFRGLDAASLL